MKPDTTTYAVTVLLVDDQALVAAAVRRALAGEADIRLHHCAKSTAAIEIAERIRPTVILQDLFMPEVDGLTLVRQYRANALTKDIPIIVLSGEEEPMVKSEAFAAGANDYVVKLPDTIELVARIRHHSRAYLNQLQRDEAYRALRDSQQQLLEANLELLRLTSVDGLTGLRNRRSFDEYLGTEWNRSSRENGLSLLMIDVDDFKGYNDTHGHLAGDEVLKAVGDVIHRVFRRPSDLAARFGGEEFVVVLPTTNLEGAQVVAERLRKAVEDLELPHRGSASGRVTISIGVAARTPELGESPLELVKAADLALYEAKRGGRNRVATYLPAG